ncbi:MAG: TRAP transporter substrate-binding protein DctP [Arenicella sp.]
MRKKIFLLLAGSVLLLSTMCLSAQTPRPLSIRFVHSEAPDSPIGLMAAYFQQSVRNDIGASNVVVEIVADYSGFSTTGLAGALLDEKIEMAAVPFTEIAEQSPRFQVFNLPFVFSGQAAASSFANGPWGERLMLTLDRRGFHRLGFVEIGMKHLVSKKRVVLPEHMNGLDVTTGDSFVEQRWIDRLGAFSNVKPYSQNSFLNAENIDGYSTHYSNIPAINSPNSKAYVLETGHIFAASLLLTSNAFWEQIPVELKTRLSDIIEDAIEFGNTTARQMQQKSRDIVSTSNQFELTELTLEERKRWVDASSSVWLLWGDEVGEQLLKEAASLQ